MGAGPGDSITITLTIDDKGRPVLKRSKTDYKNFEKDVTKSSSKIEKGFKKMFAQLTAGIGIVLALKKSFTAINEFEKSFANVTTLVDTAVVNTDEMRESLLNLGGELGSSKELTDALYQALSASVEPAKAVQFVGESAMFAKAALASTFDSVDLLTTIINAYGMAAEDAGRISDVLFKTIERGKTTGAALAGTMGRMIPIAATMGIELETVSAMLATLTQGGFKTEEAVVSISQAFTSILNPSEQALKLAKELNIEFSRRGIAAAGGFSKWLAILKERIGGNVEAFGGLFGNVRALRGILGLAGEQAKTFQNILKDLQNSSGAVRIAFQKQQQTLSAAFSKIINDIESSLIKKGLPLFGKFGSLLNQHSDAIVNFANTIIDIFGKIIQVIGPPLEIAIGIIGTLVQLLANDLKVALDIVIAAVNAVLTPVNFLLEIFKEYPGIITTVVTALTGMLILKSIASAAGAATTAMGLFAKAGLGINLLMDKVSGLAGMIGKNLTSSLKGAKFGVGKLAAATGAFVVGFEVGKLIDGWLGISKAIDAASMSMEDLAEITAFAKMQLSDHGKINLNTTEIIRKLGKELDVKSNRLKDNALAIFENKKRFDQLDTATQKVIKGFVKSTIAIKANEKALKQEAIAKKQNEEFTEILNESIGKYTKSLDILTGDRIRELRAQAAALNQVFFTNQKEIEESSRKTGIFSKEIQKLVTSFGGLSEAPKSIQDIVAAMEDLKIPLIEVPKISVEVDTAALKNITDETDKFLTQTTENMHVFGAETKETAKNSKEELAKLKEEARLLSDQFAKAAEIINLITGALQKMGLISEETAGAISGMASGISGLGAGLAQLKNPGTGFLGLLGKIQGGFSIVTSAISIAAGAFNFFKSILQGTSGEMEAAQRNLQGLTGVSDEWAEKIEKIAKELGGVGSAERAFASVLDDIIRDTEITADNFDQFIAKIRDIGATMQWAGVSAEETAKNYGAAFAAIAEKAKDLGMLGSAAFRGLIKNAEDLGLSVKEIDEFIQNALNKGAEAYAKVKETIDTTPLQTEINELVKSMEGMKTGTKEFENANDELTKLRDELRKTTELQNIFGSVSIGVYEDMFAFQNRVAENQNLVDSIGNWTIAMEEFTNVTEINQDQFSQFANTALAEYNQLIAAGFKEKEALKLMGPQLERLALLQKDYNFEIGDTVDNLIKQGIASGDVSSDMRTDQEMMIDGIGEMTRGIWELVRVMGGVLPDSMRTASDSFIDSAGRMRAGLNVVQDSVGGVIESVKDMGDEIINTDRKWHDATVGNTMAEDTKALKDEVDKVSISLVNVGGSLKGLDDKFRGSLDHIRGQFERFPQLFDQSFRREQLERGANAFLSLQSILDTGKIQENIQGLTERMKGMKRGSDQIKDAKEQLAEYQGELKETATVQEFFGNVRAGVFQDMIDFQENKEANKIFIAALEKQNEMMITNSNTMHISQQAFKEFGLEAARQLEELKNRGFSAEEALGLMGPQLQQLITLQNRWNVVADSGMKEMIEDASILDIVQGGFIEKTKTVADQTLISFAKIKEELGKGFPESLKNLETDYLTTLTKINEINAKFESDLGLIETQMAQAIAADDTEGLENLKSLYDEISERFSAATAENEKTLTNLQALIGEEMANTLDKFGLSLEELPPLEIESDLAQTVAQQIDDVEVNLTKGGESVTRFADTFENEFDRIGRSTGSVLNDLIDIIDNFNRLDRLDINTRGSLPGFANGGSFMVRGSGGTDSQLVAFRATPGERVTVNTPAQTNNVDRSNTVNQPMVTNNFNITNAGADDRQLIRVIKGAIIENTGGLRDAIVKSGVV